MISIDIINYRNIEKILKYIYDNKDALLKQNKIRCILNKNKNDTPEIILGYGKYKIIFNGNPIQVIYKEEDTPKGLNHNIEYFTRLTLCAENDTIIKNFLIEASKENTLNTFSKTTDIFITNQYGEWCLYNKVPSRNITSIYIDDSIKNKILNDLENFKKSEDEYVDFGIPYKRTYLLTGSPGGGKTSFVKGICNKYGYSLSMLSTSKNFDNESLITSIKDLPNNTILLLEDIDSLFENRNASSDNPGLTFSNLINILDGVLYKHGVVIFMTTNHPEKLDHALLRIGRIDLIAEIGFPSKDNIKKVFTYLIKSDTDFDKFYDAIKNKKVPMCAIVNFLFRYRLNWLENINDLINTNNFIKKTLKQEKEESMYS